MALGLYGHVVKKHTPMNIAGILLCAGNCSVLPLTQTMLKQTKHFEVSFFPLLGFRVCVCQILLLELGKKSCCAPMVRSAIKGTPAYPFPGRGCTATSLNFSRSAPWGPKLAETKGSLSKESEAYFLGNLLSRDTS